MIPTEDENNNEVRREDQDNINKFARLNARLHDVRREQSELKVRASIRLSEDNASSAPVSVTRTTSNHRFLLIF
jgi:hypothetical protein